jgi:hypothetical protein
MEEDVTTYNYKRYHDKDEDRKYVIAVRTAGLSR